MYYALKKALGQNFFAKSRQYRLSCFHNALIFEVFRHGAMGNSGVSCQPRPRGNPHLLLLLRHCPPYRCADADLPANIQTTHLTLSLPMTHALVLHVNGELGTSMRQFAVLDPAE
jgi:hypothetical protein